METTRPPRSTNEPDGALDSEPGSHRTPGIEYVPIVLQGDGAAGPSNPAPERLVELGAGEVLFGPGDVLDGAYRVVSGRVELVLEGRNGRELVLTSAGPGALVGEDYILNDGPSLLWAVAATDVTAAVYDREALLRQMCADPVMAESLLLSMAKKLETVTIRLHNVTFMNLECRVAKLLLAGAQNNLKLGPVTFITHSEIARCTGSCRVAVTRALQNMERAGLIERNRGYVRLLESERLSRMACAT